MRNKTYTPRYLSLLFYVFLIPYASHFLISIRERDSLISRLQNRYYWIALAYTMALSYAVAFGVAKLSAGLDQHFKLASDDIKRTFWQLLLGLMLPMVLVILMTTAYFGFFGESIIERGYFVYELPIVVLYLAILNGFYLLLYAHQKARILAEQYLQQQALLDKNKKILVYAKGEKVPINVKQIAIIDQVDLINWLIIRTGERFILHLSLKEVNKLLSGCDFFQINRKQIINKDSIKKIANGSFGKLELTLDIPLQKAVIVSKDRAKPFRAWLKGS